MQVYEVKYLVKSPKGETFNTFYKSLVFAPSIISAKNKFLSYHQANIDEGWEISVVSIRVYESFGKTQSRMIII